MAGITFAGSNGLLDVPAPAWVEAEEAIFSKWGVFMVAMIKHGTVESLRRDEELQLEADEFGLMIDGGIFALVESAPGPGNKDQALRSTLVSFLSRGDLFTAALSGAAIMQFRSNYKSTCLIVRQQALEAFRREFPTWASAQALLRTRTAEAYTQALLDTMGRDQEKIHRVLAIFAGHPTATKTEHGNEFEAGKQLIRDLAGVQKRSASRAFTALEDSGVVSFSGYKRICYREPLREEQVNQHQQAGKVCKRTQQHF